MNSENRGIADSGSVGIDERWAQRKRGHRGNGDTETLHTGTVDTQEQWERRNSGHRGTMGNEKQ